MAETERARQEAREAEKKRFFDLADRLAGLDRAEQRFLKDELARMTFGSAKAEKL